MLKKFFGEASAQAWTLGGTGLVLITLSGSTRTIGIWISVISLVMHLVGVFTNKEDEVE
jgi:hypothetical protein